MTREEIENMQAGREMDICIAELITGQSRLTCRVDPTTRDGEPQFHWGYPTGHDFAPEYSTNISAAFEVFKEGLTRFGQAAILADMEDYGRGTFFGNGPEEVMTVIIGGWQVTAKVEVAICKAMLIAALESATSTGEGE